MQFERFTYRGLRLRAQDQAGELAPTCSVQAASIPQQTVPTLFRLGHTSASVDSCRAHVLVALQALDIASSASYMVPVEINVVGDSSLTDRGPDSLGAWLACLSDRAVILCNILLVETFSLESPVVASQNSHACLRVKDVSMEPKVLGTGP